MGSERWGHFLRRSGRQAERAAVPKYGEIFLSDQFTDLR